MEDKEHTKTEEEIPYMQKLYDRPFVWLIAGFITMLSFYTLWGIYEIVSLPQSPLP
ncbi:MAG: hypothetical protein MK008_14575 [Bdellovibrionales bacterium]|nr:hypothetical protein [Bdellovibrionales bacterium]